MIDDDVVFLNVMSRSLRRKGCNVDSVENGNSALLAMESSQYDVILLDLNLNGESGLQLLKHILKRQPDARIVMLTAYASIATAVEAIKRGAENYLCKPVNAQDVLNMIYDVDNDGDKKLREACPLPVDQLEWEHLQRVLLEHDGNISATARALNMHRRTLQRKLQKRPVKNQLSKDS